MINCHYFFFFLSHCYFMFRSFIFHSSVMRPSPRCHGRMSKERWWMRKACQRRLLTRLGNMSVCGVRVQSYETKYYHMMSEWHVLFAGKYSAIIPFANTNLLKKKNWLFLLVCSELNAQESRMRRCIFLYNIIVTDSIVWWLRPEDICYSTPLTTSSYYYILLVAPSWCVTPLTNSHHLDFNVFQKFTVFPLHTFEWQKFPLTKNSIFSPLKYPPNILKRKKNQHFVLTASTVRNLNCSAFP